MTHLGTPDAWQKAAGHAAKASELLSGDPCRCGDAEHCPHEDAQLSIAQLAQAHAATGHLYAVLGQAADGDPAREAADVAAWAGGLGLADGELDDLIHDAFSRQASEANNGGLESQVRSLVGMYGLVAAQALVGDYCGDPEARPAVCARCAKSLTRTRGVWFSADDDFMCPDGEERHSPVRRAQ